MDVLIVLKSSMKNAPKQTKCVSESFAKTTGGKHAIENDWDKKSNKIRQKDHVNPGENLDLFRCHVCELGFMAHHDPGR